MDYVIIKTNGKVLRFSDGDIVFYGELKEALADAAPGEQIITFNEYEKKYNPTLKPRKPMANYCLTHFILECEDQIKLERIHDAITRCNSSDYPEPEDRSCPYWIGNIFKELGLDYKPERTFWTDAYFEDNALHIFEESAWSRGGSMAHLVSQMDDPNDEDNDIIVYFYSEEPGCCIYESNDDCHCHFFDEYILDTNDGLEYYDDFSRLLFDVSEHIEQTLECKDFEELEKYLEEYNKSHIDDEQWAYVHEIDYSASF